MFLLRKFFIRFILPIVWFFKPSRKAIALEQFSVTEIDSAWQSIYAMRITPDPKLRAKLFQHALEEVNHGALFHQLARNYSDVPPTSPVIEKEPLLKTDKSPHDALVDFYAYEYLGEKSVRDEFDSYAAAVPAGDIRELFKRAKEDEKGHALYTGQTLNQLVGNNPRRRHWLTVKTYARRLYEAWLRLGRLMGEIPSLVILSVLYYVGGIFLKSLCCRRLVNSYHLENESIPPLQTYTPIQETS